LLVKVSQLESELGDKFSFQLEGARDELVTLVASLRSDLASQLETLEESQAGKEKKLKELVLSLGEQEALLKEKIQELSSLQSAIPGDRQDGDTLKLEIQSLSNHVTRLEAEVADMMAGRLSSCCPTSGDIEAAVRAVLEDLLAGSSSSRGLSDQLAAWLGHLFVSRSELEERLLTATKLAGGGTESQEELVTRITERIRAEISQNATTRGAATANATTAAMTHEEVLRIVQAALVQYDADKTGQFDYALETAGGSVVSTRCTETYVQKTALYSIFGIPVWYPSNNPRTIIQPGVQPGQCWAFKVNIVVITREKILKSSCP
jgi:hypothetical protein